MTNNYKQFLVNYLYTYLLITEKHSNWDIEFIDFFLDRFLEKCERDEKYERAEIINEIIKQRKND